MWHVLSLSLISGFLVFCSVQPVLAAESSEESCVKILSVPEHLKFEVQKMEVDARREQAEAETAAAQVKAIKTQITRLKTGMNWAEKNLWRWLARLLGGDAAKIDGLKTKEKRQEYLQGLLHKEKTEAQTADGAVLDKIDKWLIANNAKFAQLRLVETQLNKMVCKGETCLTKIAAALEEVDEAETMELIDMASSNKGISALSYLETSDADDAARDAQREVRRYIKAVKELKTKLEMQAVQIRNVSDTIDLAVDLVFDFSFDFLSVFNFFALGDLKDDLGEIQTQVTEIHQSFTRQHESLRKELDVVLCQVRRLCNGQTPK